MKAFEYTTSVLLPLIPATCQSGMHYIKLGNKFVPTAHIIVGDDFDSQEAARVTLERFGKHAEVLWIERGLVVSLQIQFPPHLAACPVKFYNSLPDKMPKRRASKVPALLSTVPDGFSGHLFIPHDAASWSALVPLSGSQPFDARELQAHVDGIFETHVVVYNDTTFDMHMNEEGLLHGLPVNRLATALATEARLPLSPMAPFIVGDVLLTFGECREGHRGVAA
jgi:hypothetical protein